MRSFPDIYDDNSINSLIVKGETPLCYSPHICIWEKHNSVSNSIPDFTVHKYYWEPNLFPLNFA